MKPRKNADVVIHAWIFEGRYQSVFLRLKGGGRKKTHLVCQYRGVVGHKMKVCLEEIQVAIVYILKKQHEKLKSQVGLVAVIGFLYRW